MRAKLFIFLIAAAVAGVIAYKFFLKPKPAAEPVALTESARVTQLDTNETKAPLRTSAVVTTAAVMTNKAKAALPKAPPPTGEWKDKMDGILASNANAGEKMRLIKELLSQLPDPDAEHAVSALARSVDNDAFGFIKPLVVDPTLPEPVRDEFMVDLLNRPNAIKVPLFLEIARNPDHPDHEEAFNSLEIFTGLKLGADWNGWEKALPGWIAEHPDPVRKPKAAPTEGAN